MRTHSLALLVFTVLGLSACSRPEAPSEPIRAVKLATVSASGLTARQEMAGEVRARQETRMGFRVGGKLVQRPAEVGQRVKAGQLLAQLDASDLALASEAAKAQATAALTQRDLAEADLKRFTDLKAKGFVSGAEIERRQANMDAAEASLKQARAQSAVQGNQAGYTRLLADADGVVVAVDAEVGQVVSAGAPVVRIARDGARDVVFSVPESQLAQVSQGLEAQVRLWAAAEAGPGGYLTGVVREVAASADPATRTYQVKLALPADAAVPLGATAYVSFAQVQGAAVDVIKLPTSALMRGSATDKTNSAVWVFDAASGTVQSRPVQVAGVDGNQVVIASGLKVGEEVVTAGVHVLSPGQKVTRFAAAAQ
ncbi:efflux transporter periplasmic adaptor subunit [Hydrogenophaga crassostreae]|uniref:Efflux transporter periplasmic adaptor subunit n=1 Tax=Hydrogenophaga crassostreae TaxID=1763535 RepID=A0A162T073_9BURK|nr:efflux RND transporter periplasmic adaptor subunit [Hydrogenophaga crassostreae]AOW13705.1 efflux transporter periplasmic adaptor subunit [Hydrogenophaga crassostreae]OAD42001.1 efflux transporter periplasmic adaptor subunit [Hydrogenophaga crassostreae]